MTSQNEFDARVREYLEQLQAGQEQILEYVKQFGKPDRAKEAVAQEAARKPEPFGHGAKFSELRLNVRDSRGHHFTEHRGQTPSQARALLNQLTPSELARTVDGIDDVRVLHSLVFSK